ncbi:peptidase G1 domain-containing protein [Phanerochaete sordida]|uniref:Peptidase G1 domain-containing protein n=1 Tax=Phanerochaete sordida TaxID=48140 RepID=A0A9P3GJI5_9APHY|nr:peptidase G1 domain-containing protein [Phanerochaete sordida]
MLFSTLLASALLATSTVAVPTAKERFEARVARRASSGASHASINKVEVPTRSRANRVSSTKVSQGTKTQFSDNWAGAVLSSAGGTWSSVFGVITVPTPKAPKGEKGSFAASAWVGIDGDTCGSAILQTGIDLINDNGNVTYTPWFEWYPDFAFDIGGFDISPGDTLALYVEADSATTGYITIANEVNGQEVWESLSSTSPLCQQDAEWIVEDYEENGSLVPLANFGTVEFDTITAITTAGDYFGNDNATQFDIQQTKTLTKVTFPDTGTVSVTYV